MGFMKFGGVALVLAGAYGMGQVQSASTFNAAADRYQLSSEQVDVMRTCLSSMSRYSRSFKKGASKELGCACIAQKVTAVIDRQYYAAAGRVVDVFMQASKSGNSRAVLLNAMTRDRVISKITESTRLSMFGAVGRAIAPCGDAKTHA